MILVVSVFKIRKQESQKCVRCFVKKTETILLYRLRVQFALKLTYISLPRLLPQHLEIELLGKAFCYIST